MVSGTTGESPTTTVAEDGEILAAVKDAVGDRASVVAGVGTNSTAHSLELAQQAEKIGADGLLLVTPYYNKPGQAGVLHHFRTVAEATGVPVMLYDVPGRTGTTISLETYAAAKEIETVVAVKDAVNDFVRGVKLRELGLRRLLRRRRQQPRLAGPRRGRLRLGRRPRRRQRDPGDARGLRARRPRRGARDLHPAAARDRRGDGRGQLRRHHRQGRRSSCSACSTTATSAARWCRSTTTRSPPCASASRPPACCSRPGGSA